MKRTKNKLKFISNYQLKLRDRGLNQIDQARKQAIIGIFLMLAALCYCYYLTIKLSHTESINHERFERSTYAY